MSKHKYHMGVDVAHGEDSTAFAHFRKRELRWWEKLLTRFFKSYETKQPLELLDSWVVPTKKENDG